MQQATLTVPSGTVFGYYDPGTPQGQKDYRTVFAIHGFMFNAYVWKEAMPLATRQNIRLVSINRPGYGKSSPLSLVPRPGEDFEAGFKNSALDLLEFIHAFVEKEMIAGDLILLGWSFGALDAVSAIANIHNARDTVQHTMKKLKKLIMHEPGQVSLGFSSSKTYFYMAVLPILPQSEHSFFQSWVTSYFDHPPESLKPDVIYEYFKKAISDVPAIMVCGTRTSEHLVIPAWQAEAEGVKVTWIEGGNHLSHWDMPEHTLAAYFQS
ncbi:Alpha/Beta hydrolase protein [Flagelloscypha sp. PMI_526]|nr:Alpha/Beta hydrolase protein [Flagelloscypha sp. PMI_526]